MINKNNELINRTMYKCNLNMTHRVAAAQEPEEQEPLVQTARKYLQLDIRQSFKIMST